MMAIHYRFADVLGEWIGLIFYRSHKSNNYCSILYVVTNKMFFCVDIAGKFFWRKNQKKIGGMRFFVDAIQTNCLAIHGWDINFSRFTID